MPSSRFCAIAKRSFAGTGASPSISGGVGIRQA
jgi:hypothetical protein